MGGFSVDIREADLKRALKHIDRWSDRKQTAIRRAVNTAAINVQRGAKEACPVDTGRLRASIAIAFDGAGRDLPNMAAGLTRDEYKAMGRLRPKFGKNIAAGVGTNVEYASFVEFGTSRNRAQPFLVPAAEQERIPLRRAVAEVLRDD